MRNWTLGQKLGLGFALVVAFSVAIAGVGVYALKTAVASKEAVISINAQNLILAERARTALEQKGGAGRGFLLTRQEAFVTEMHEARSRFSATLQELRQTESLEEGRRSLAEIEAAESAHQAVVERAFAAIRAGTATSVLHTFDIELLPLRKGIDQRVEAFITREQRALADARRASSAAAASAVTLVTVMAVAAVILAALLAFLLTRGLTRQIGSTVQHVQSSSAELQAAANQQATGAREQATAMSEITTTISELLATSRQIASSAQRVAEIAEQTAAGARAGDQTVQRSQDSVASIRQQVDQIVGHMLELGKKSQQIGGILEVINELAEQTNILAINATIEAAGAGEVGRRFTVVADEIRKLAERVGGSTKDIRSLIDEVRGAVNTTVMSTEAGSKAVEVGARQFGEVASAFQHIAGLVRTTSEAAREIELSTKQQTTAVEQVNLAISNVAQASKETESSSNQTLQTSAQLATLSRNLASLIQPAAAA